MSKLAHHPNLQSAGAFGNNPSAHNPPQKTGGDLSSPIFQRLFEKSLPLIAKHAATKLADLKLLRFGADDETTQGTIRGILKGALKDAIEVILSDAEAIKERNRADLAKIGAKRNTEKEKLRLERERAQLEIERERTNSALFRKAALELLSVEDFMLVRDYADELKRLG